MNWLAHVYLSEPNVEFRLGNLLADYVKGKQRQGLSIEFLRGAARHQRIDAFTDSHWVMDRSRSRIASPFRRYAGILCDIFMDHFLARKWNDYSPIPLLEFTTQFYAEIRLCPLVLPPQAAFIVEKMIQTNRLASYAQRQGIEETLWRLSHRIKERIGTEIHLEKAIVELDTHQRGFEIDFDEFFPELCHYVKELALAEKEIR